MSWHSLVIERSSRHTARRKGLQQRVNQLACHFLQLGVNGWLSHPRDDDFRQGDILRRFVDPVAESPRLTKHVKSCTFTGLGKALLLVRSGFDSLLV